MEEEQNSRMLVTFVAPHDTRFGVQYDGEVDWVQILGFCESMSAIARNEIIAADLQIKMSKIQVPESKIIKPGDIPQ